MDKSVVREILKGKNKKIAKLGNAVQKDLAPENIHKFRVEIKRLRSFLRLLAADKSYKEIKLPKKLKKLYDICGTIREAQLEQKKIAEIKLVLPAYAAHLSLQINKQRKIWASHYDKDGINKLKKKIQDSKIPELSPDALHLFICDSLLNIKKTVQGNPCQ